MSSQPQRRVSPTARDCWVGGGAEEAEKRASAILDSITDGFAAIDREWRFTYVNPAYEALSGRRREELLGKTIYEAFPEVRGTRLEREYGRAVKENVAISLEEYFAPMNKWFSLSAYPSGNGGLAVYVRDVTDRKRFGEALLENEERFRQYFEQGLIGMAITSPQKGCVEVNDEICRILGYERDELLGKTWTELTHPDDLAADVSNFLRVMSGEIDGFSVEKRWIRKDRQAIHTSVSVKCVRSAEGVAQYFLALLQDITARRQAEEALEMARNELERRVSERTVQLLESNEKLHREIAERKQAQAEANTLKEELAEELAAMKRLHEFTNRLLATTELQSVLQEVLNESIVLQNADFGTVQLINPETGALEIIAQQGFQEEFLTHFAGVREPDSASGRSLQQRQREIIEDVLTDEAFAAHRLVAATAGFRAVQSTPLFSRNGEPLGILSTHFRAPHRPSERELRLTDLYVRQAAELIERKRAEEALRESEERFRRYFDLGLVGMAITSPTKGCLEVNDELCRILGYERDELLHMTWAEMTHPDDLAADVANFNRVLARGFDGYSIDKRWIRKDGRIVDSIMAVKCVRRTNGTVDYFVGFVQDITERKRAEEEQRKLAALFENSPDFIGLASLDGAVHVVNPAGRAMVGLESPVQVVQTRVLDYIAEEDRAMFQQVLADVLRDGEWEGETRFRHFKHGGIIPSRQHIFLVREPGTERPVAMATIARDITESRRSEEALRAARNQLAHIARVTTMGELAASIAHEVNQPLTAVVTNGDAGLRWLSQSPPNVEEAQKAMEEMVMQGHRASEVIARIRAQLKKTKTNISNVDTKDLIEEALALTRQKVEEHGVTVTVLVAPDIPPVSGDSVQLQQVLVNLILNALEATNASGNGERELLVTSRRQGANEVVIAVNDSGTGIDPQHMDQLFRPFFTTKGTGLGMGLAISRSIVEAHGGRLWATSKEKRGATFQFSLPIGGAD